MLVGSIPLNHPALHLRPQFQAAVKESETSQVLLFDTKDQADLGTVLQDSAKLNRTAADQLRTANAAYTKAREADQPGSFEIISNSREPITQQWSNLSKLSEASLKTAANLAAHASHSLGAVIMGSCEQLGEGVQKLSFYPQTSREGLIGSGSKFADLTGDGYQNRMDMSISGGEVQISEPLFNPQAQPAGSMIVDSKMGVAVLKDLR